MDPVTAIGLVLVGGVGYGAYAYFWGSPKEVVIDSIEIEMQPLPNLKERKQLSHPTKQRPLRKGV